MKGLRTLENNSLKTEPQIIDLFINQIVLDENGYWAILLKLGDYQKTISGKDSFKYNQTENRIALIAFLTGLKMLKHTSTIVLFTKSEYLINGILNEFEGTDSKNQALWAECAKYAKLHKVHFVLCNPKSNLEEMSCLKKMILEEISKNK